MSLPPTSDVRRRRDDPRRLSINTLPDTISHVFAPGWDVTYSNDPRYPDHRFLATFGLGSPFPEDMKLCAAANGMWAGSSPDAARTFYPDLVPFKFVGRPATAVPLVDAELGFHPNSSAVLEQEADDRPGWDGEYGPYLVIDRDQLGRPAFAVNYADMMLSDYVANSTRGEFDLGRLRQLDEERVLARMNALGRCIRRLPGLDRVRSTELWLVSAEEVADWGSGADGLGIPRLLGLHGDDRRIAAAPGIRRHRLAVCVRARAREVGCHDPAAAPSAAVPADLCVPDRELGNSLCAVRQPPTVRGQTAVALGPSSSPFRADVLVAGGGPAGTAAAMTCAAAGLSVALAAPPGKAGEGFCAWETLHPEALPLLNLLGAHEVATDSSVGHFHSFKAGGQRRRLASGNQPAWHVDRARFDDLLLKIAANAGVSVLPSPLTGAGQSSDGILAVLEAGATVQARWMIDATGRKRTASRLMGSRYRRLSAALISRTALAASAARGKRGTEFSAHPWGWTWLTGAHGGHRTWTAVHAARATPPEEIKGLLAASVAGSLRTSSATWYLAQSAEGAPVLPVGDAAGSIDPASGLGMTNALASGLAAGKTVAMCLGNPLAAEWRVARYHEWWDDRLEGQARMLRRLYEDNGIGLS